MKILICLYSINNYGGITTYVEELHRGFQALGHTVQLMLLSETDRKPYNRRHSKRPGNFESSWEGFTANPDTGWGGVPVWSYATLERTKEFRRHASKFDLVVWGVPVPSWSKLHAVPKWYTLYNMDTPQIAVIHDGNFRYLYPHLNHVAPRLRGVACVHGSAFQSAQQFDGASAFIPNPHPLKKHVPWEEKKPFVVAAHMWKAWKHMELAVKAAPFLKQSKIYLGGDGIERRYMTSPDKCKPKYEGIWSAMLESGNGKFLDILPQPELWDLYAKCRVMLDPSFSKNYNKMGSHFNRSVFEAYNAGMVPVCMESNMQLEGVFKEGKTHIGIPDGASPKKIAHILDGAVHMDADSANRIIRRGRELIKTRFHRKIVAQNMIDLSNGKDCGLTDALFHGSPSDRMKAATANIVNGGRPKDRVL